jgi:plastocyanin
MKNFLIQSMMATLVLCGTGLAVAGGIKGKVTAQGARDNADAVVYIDKIPSKTFPAPTKHAEFNQQNLMFHPHVLPILVGTTVDFLNSDDVLHNVFSPDACADKFNLGTWPKGQKRSFTFKHADCNAVILCNVHPEMEAYVVVLSTPYFATSAKDGNYEIKDVPPGKYTLKIWHEKLKGQPVTVEVPEKGDATVNFLIKR